MKLTHIFILLICCIAVSSNNSITYAASTIVDPSKASPSVVKSSSLTTSYSNTTFTKKTPASVRDSEKKGAPAWMVYFAFFISILTLLWNVNKHFLDKKNSKETRISILENAFWVEHVLSPFCVKPLIEFTQNEAKKLSEIHKKGGSNLKSELILFQKSFKENKDEIISNYLILNEDLYDSLSSKIDEMDDIVTMHCASHLCVGIGGIDTSYLDPFNARQALYSKVSNLLSTTISSYKR